MTAHWAPTAAMMLLSLLSYVDRNVLAILSNTILADVKLTAEQYGQMISAFSAAYLVGNPLWGWALDRFGVRVGLFASVAIWTAASTSHAFATSLVFFAGARAVLGFGEGATFPGGLRTPTQTLRAGERARGIALAYSGGSLGAMIAPLVVSPIAVRWGWRAAFLFTGALGVAWLALWAKISRDPRLARRSDESAAAGPSSLVAAARPRLRDPALWGFMAAYAFGGLPLGFVLYGAPLHLGRALHCDQTTLGHVLWIPPLGWEVGYFWWGWVVDRYASRGALTPRIFQRVFTLLAVLALALGLAPLTSSRALVLALLFWAMFVAAGFVIVSLTEATRSYGDAHAAYLAGLGAGSWSGLVMLVMPVLGRLIDRADFRGAYAIAAVAPVVGAVLWRSARWLSDSVADGPAR
jgi:MFS transporter, ACS family, hexuronate transporter